MANNKDFKVKNGIQPTAYHEAVGTVVSGVDNVGPVGAFSTDLYTGTSAAQTITNDIDLAGDGGLVWIKGRSNASNHHLVDTERGSNKFLITNSDNAEATSNAGSDVTSFNSDGFSFGTYYSNINFNGYTYVAWSFKKQSSFFDIVEYTGTGSVQSIDHSLGSKPGFIIVKKTSTSGTSWFCQHRSLGATKRLLLNATNQASTTSAVWGDTEPTSTQFTVGTGNSNDSGGTYIAYLFAHDTSDDSSIKCGSFSTDSGSLMSVDLGWQPQWVMYKKTNGTGQWYIEDVERSLSESSVGDTLVANLNNAEGTGNGAILLTSTGFESKAAPNNLGASGDYIYIAIRKATSTNTETLDLSTGSVFEITPTSDIQINLSNPADSGTVSAATLLLDGAATSTHDLSATSFENSLDVSSQDTAPTDLFIADSGTKLYVVGEQTDDIYQYNLSTAWDISTASYQTNYAIPSGNGTNPTGIFVKPDGTKLYVSMENTEDITQYSMSTAFDLSTISDDGVVYTIPSGANSLTRSVFFKSDGTKLYTTADSSGTVYQHTLSTAWDISTASYDSVSFVADPDNTYNNLKGLSVDSTGKNFYLLDRDYDEVFKYTLSTAWDISTASFSERVDISAKETNGEGIFVKPDGTKFYITGTTSDSIHQYSIAPPATITYDSTLEFAGGTAPTSPAVGETDVLTFSTRDGGTSYQAALAIDGAK